MADNITIMNGAGTLLASNEIDGVQVLRVKVQAGVDGTGTDVSESNPLPVDVRSPPGLAVFRDIGLGTLAQSVSGGAVRLFGWYLANSGTLGVFVKVYDSEMLPHVGGSTPDTPAATLFVPPGNAISSGYSNGIAFENGIWVAATTGAGDGDTGAPATGTVIVNLFYR